MISELVSSVMSALSPDRTRDMTELVRDFRADPITRPQLASWLPYSAFREDEKIFVNTDSLGFCLEVMPQSGADEDMTKILQAVYSPLPAGASVQISLLASPHIESTLRQYGALRLEDEDIVEQSAPLGRPARNTNVYRLMARRRVEYLMRGARENMFHGRIFRLRNFRMVFSVTVPGHVDDLSRLEDIVVLRDSIAATLLSANFYNRVWSAEDLLNWCSDILNPDRLYGSHPPRAYDPNADLRDQIVDRDTRNLELETGLLLHKPLGEHAIELRMLSVKSYPERYSLWKMGAMIGDLFQSAQQYPCPFMITMGVFMLDQVKARNVAYVNSANADREARSQVASIFPHMAEKDRDWKAVTSVIVNRGAQMVGMYHQLMLFTAPEKATQAQRVAESIWQARGFALNSDCYIQRAGLVASLPMTLSAAFHADLKTLRIVQTKTSFNAVNLAPMIAEWQGSETPAILFAGRRGQIIKLDIFDNRQGGKNIVIAGKTGSGKSVLLNEIVATYLGLGAKAWIIDVGKSYQRTCSNVGGQFIQFTQDTRICINPFSAVNDFSEDFSLLLPLLLRMASPHQELDPFYQKALGVAMTRVWDDYGPQTTITRICDLLKTGKADPTHEHIDQRCRDLSLMLEDYSERGVFGRFFEGPSNVAFDRDLVVLELEELKRKKALQQIVLMYFIYRIAQEMYLDRERRKLVVMDEAREFLGAEGTDNQMMANFIDEGYARARKYNGSFTLATQGVDHYYASKAGISAFNNADFTFLMNQKPEALEALQASRHIAMDDGMKRLLSSLRTEQGEFSEVYLHTPNGSGIARLLPDPFNLLLFSNRPEDNVPLDARMAAGLSVTEAIEDLMRERGQL